MAFIPNSSNSLNRVGKEAVLIRDCVAMKGTILKGSVVVLIGYGPRGFDIRDKESGEVITECGTDCVH